MDKEQTKQAIAVMQAYVDGKQIQCKHRGGAIWWPMACTNNPLWDFAVYEYSIAPIKKKIEYRRYMTIENDICVLNKLPHSLSPEQLEKRGCHFNNWIDTDWQVYEYEESQ